MLRVKFFCVFESFKAVSFSFDRVAGLREEKIDELNESFLRLCHFVFIFKYTFLSTLVRRRGSLCQRLWKDIFLTLALPTTYDLHRLLFLLITFKFKFFSFKLFYFWDPAASDTSSFPVLRTGDRLSLIARKGRFNVHI